jgi:hypothetical protein
VTRDELIARALAFAGAAGGYPFGEDLLTVKAGGKEVTGRRGHGRCGWRGGMRAVDLICR